MTVPVIQTDGQDFSKKRTDDYNQWLLDQSEYTQGIAELQKMLQNATGANYLKALAALSTLGDTVGTNLKIFADINNTASDLQGEVGQIESDLNSVLGQMQSKAPGTSPDSAIQGLLDKVNDIEGFLKSPQAQKIVDSTTINNMQEAISSLKAQFGTHWGNVTAMKADLQGWFDQMTKTGQYPPAISTLLSSMRTLNQSTSAFSTETNTKLQSEIELYRMIFGIITDIMKMHNDQNSYIINNKTKN